MSNNGQCGYPDCGGECLECMSPQKLLKAARKLNSDLTAAQAEVARMRETMEDTASSLDATADNLSPRRNVYPADCMRDLANQLRAALGPAQEEK